MDLYLDKPNYRLSPIRSVAALAKALRFDASVLIEAASTANNNWRRVPPEPGSTRETFDARGLLKEIHSVIKTRIFEHTYFPPYLQGSLKGCDYVTNAKIHTNKKILICEDVKSFFPSVTADRVEDIWCGFFGFPPAVARLLTALTTKDGALPQGAITSSYLANLVLWRAEPLLHAKFAAQGITYSRYVDDMCMSADAFLSKPTRTWVIAQVYGMLRQSGLKAKRIKHEMFWSDKPMIATKLIVNAKPSLSQKKRSQVRAQVRQVEIAHMSGTDPEVVRDLANKAAQRVGQLGRLHKTPANRLKDRVKFVRAALPVQSISAITKPRGGVAALPSGAAADVPPWE